MSGFRFIAAGGSPVAVTVDGRALTLSSERSLLASLLAMDVPLDFACAIGQCQRCLCEIDGARRASCLYYPKGGEVVATTKGNARA